METLDVLAERQHTQERWGLTATDSVSANGRLEVQGFTLSTSS